ncbi:hypothetical protein [Hwangdonia lutea]|uniref:Uncharacterized protein n=1 Tax=Hwangdonia lutea TaxID=3075823 RepID=A0AA97EL84_9FLAO|nr:hypothetical protein [Hwangdonia sp. SCSIO 19198]WOD43287.1 hypothetical protein RNZ46_14955 [Hwangdonia sp. SCSIO 19198]
MENIKTQYVFSENNQVSIKTNKEENEWYPINFQWIPVKKLSESMNQ